MKSVAEVSQAVFRAERELGLLELRVDGAHPWERIRFAVHRAIQQGAGLIDEPHERLPRGWLARAGVVARRAACALRRGPRRARPADYLFVGHPRRKRAADGTWWDLYCDPVLPLLDGRAVYAEEPNTTGHFAPARTPDRRCLDGFWLAAVAADVFVPAGLTAEAGRVLELAGRQLHGETGVPVDVRGMASTALRRRRATLPLYRRLLARLRPRVVVVVVSYGKESLIEAARERGIPVVELQHGVIHRHHLGYAYPGGTKRCFPDWLLAFGDYWRRAAPYPIRAERVVSVGYPYFEAEAARHRGVGRRDQVLFLSQGAIGAPLSRLAVELAALQPSSVAYKLHPAEYRDWRTRYPWLDGSPVRVLDSDDVPLYRHFAESRAQVGVFSTAVYEGLGFGLPTFLAELPGVESMEDLLASGAARRVGGAAELAAQLGCARAAAPDVDAFFRRDAARNVVAELERICARTARD